MEFIIVCLIILILFSFYDSYRHRWETNRTNKLSLTWHSLGWSILFMVASYTYYKIYGISFDGWKEILLLSSLSWILKDVIWNKMDHMPILYAGNGKGGKIEEFIFYLSTKIKKSPEIIMVLLKSILIIITIFCWAVF